MKITACAISKNEEKHVKQWLHYTRDCDTRIVVDTGSTDRTVELLRKAEVQVIEKTWSPFRFDEPRNLALSFVPSDVDWIISPDFDEYFEDGWRQSVENAVRQNPLLTQITYNTHCSSKEGVGPGLEEGRKIHNRSYKWVQPVHEYLVYSGSGDEKRLHSDEILLFHKQDLSVNRENHYHSLALEHLKNDPDNEYLVWFCLMGSVRKCDSPDIIVEIAERYLKLTKSHTYFRSIAYNNIGCALYRKKATYPEVMIQFLRGLAEDPGNTVSWNLLAQAAQEANDLPTYAFASSRLLDKNQAVLLNEGLASVFNRHPNRFTSHPEPAFKNLNI